MKKLIWLFIWGWVGWVASEGCAQPAFNLFSQTKTQVIIPATDASTGTVLSDPIDVGNYGGIVNVLVTITSTNAGGAAGQAVVTVQHADRNTNNSTGWLLISNAVIGTYSTQIITNFSYVATDVQRRTTNNVSTGANSEPLPGVARYNVATNEAATIIFGIPVRDNNRFWKVTVTNLTSRASAISATLIGRNMQSN